MKKCTLLSLFVFLLMFSAESFSQSIVQFNFLEIIVVQKANNRGEVKRIRVEEKALLKDNDISIRDIENIEETSTLLNYMNAHNWEFVDRQSVVSDDDDPVWMSYIFKKRK